MLFVRLPALHRLLVVTVLGFASGQPLALTGQALQAWLSRDMERELDRIGHSLMAHVGFAPSGMAAMFDKLDQGNRLNDSGAFP